jgi:hypothetical protein
MLPPQAPALSPRSGLARLAWLRVGSTIVGFVTIVVFVTVPDHLDQCILQDTRGRAMLRRQVRDDRVGLINQQSHLSPVRVRVRVRVKGRVRVRVLGLGLGLGLGCRQTAHPRSQDGLSPSNLGLAE